MVLAFSIVLLFLFYCSPALRTDALLLLTNSSGMNSTFASLCLLKLKCSDTASSVLC